MGTAYKYDQNGNPIPVGEVINGTYQGAWFDTPEQAKSPAVSNLDNDYSKGYTRGKKEFYDDPDMQDLKKRNEDLAKGYDGNTLGAIRGEARDQIQGQRSNYMRQLQSRVGKAGIGGARGAAMAGAADKGFMDSTASSERKMAIDNSNLQREGTGKLQDFIFRQKYGTLGSAIGEQQAGLAERGKYAAAQANQSGGGGMSWLCTEIAKNENWTMSDLKALKKLLLFTEKHDKEASERYQKDAPTLIAIMKDKSFDFMRLQPTIKCIISLVKIGLIEMAYENYKNMTMDLVNTYWGDYGRA
ncbi:MAG TPA: hypothetical protein VIG33_14865 [Pseudobdellovibrionaceae bacterium]|jgi:hypothetical protein